MNSSVACSEVLFSPQSNHLKKLKQKIKSYLWQDYSLQISPVFSIKGSFNQKNGLSQGTSENFESIGFLPKY